MQRTVRTGLTALATLLLGTGVLGLTSDQATSEAAPDANQIADLHAFARLYGLVRFFHPSDEASAIDWDRFAAYGATRILDPDRAHLRTTLEALFTPIAPSIQIYEGEDGDQEAPPAPVTTARSDSVHVAWQHQGVLISPERFNVYRSVRTNRTSEMAAPGRGFGTLARSLDATPYRGKRIRLRARARFAGRGADDDRAQLWMRVDRSSGEPGFFDNMQDRPITSDLWVPYEITGRVDTDGERITFGALVQGMGPAGFDAFELHVQHDDGTWHEVPVPGGGFEDGPSSIHPEPGGDPIRPSGTGRWEASSPGFEVSVSSDAALGEHAAWIRLQTRTITAPLFDEMPPPGTLVDRALGAGLRVRLPISLASDEQGTLPHAPPGSFEGLTAALDSIEPARLSPERPAVRVAAIVEAWNVFQHFYPYFDVVETDWPSMLSPALERALAAEDGEAFFRTLHWLLEALDDGHGRVIHPDYGPKAGLPWRVEWIEERPVVTASADSALRPGDVVVSIDGMKADREIERREALISGSRQWKRWRAVSTLGRGARGTRAAVRVRRNGHELGRTLTRTRGEAPVEFDRPALHELEPGIWYVDLDRAPWASIAPELENLAAADGVVFDLRGYPAGNHAILRHLLASPDTSSAWMRTPRVIYPDRQGVIGARTAGWNLRPSEPHIGGRVAFITDARALSYAESLLSFVEHYDLGELVGQPTAGVNGNMNQFTVPGGYTLGWTGMRVVKHDGSQHHLVGVLPTIPAARTIAGVREGRDELLEVALRAIRER